MKTYWYVHVEYHMYIIDHTALVVMLVLLPLQEVVATHCIKFYSNFFKIVWHDYTVLPF